MESSQVDFKDERAQELASSSSGANKQIIAGNNEKVILASQRGPADFLREIKLEGNQRRMKHEQDLEPMEGSFADAKAAAAAAAARCFVISPSVVHFGGYKLGEEYELKIRIANASQDSLPIRIQHTQSFTFETSYKPHSRIPPGLCEVVKIKFRPTEWKYYRDSIIVTTEGAKQEIPVHGYPVVNRVDVPRVLDFGSCVLNQSHTRTLKLSCKVPMPFDFEVMELTPHAEFKIYPHSGQVPANGETHLTVEYIPHQLKVSSYSFRLNVAQFGFEPIICTVTGSSRPGLIRSAEIEREERAYLQEVSERYDTHHNPNFVESLKSIRFDNYGDAFIPHKKRSAHYDPGGASIHAKEEQKTTSNNNNNDPNAMLSLGDGSMIVEEGPRLKPTVESPSKSSRKPTSNSEMIVIENIRFPKILEGSQATNFVLTQQPNKLKPKDLKEAINKQRRAREAEKRAKDSALRKFGSVERMDPVQRILNEDMRAADQSSTAQVKEMIFLQHVLEIEDEEKSREFASQAVHVGEQQLEEEEVLSIRKERQQATHKASLVKRQEERLFFGTKCLGPTSVPPFRACAKNDTDTGLKSGSNFEEPSFDYFVNDDWRRRKAVTVRFINIIGKILVRKRAQRRIDAIWKRLGSARTRKAVRALVEEDHIRAKLSTSSSSNFKKPSTGSNEPSWKKHKREIMKKPANQLKPMGTQALLKKLSDSQATLPAADSNILETSSEGTNSTDALQTAFKSDTNSDDTYPREAWTDSPVPETKIIEAGLKEEAQLHLVSFPLFNDSTVFESKPVPTAPVQGFQDLGYFKLRAPEEFKLCGYERFDYPHLTQFVPRCDDIELIEGAHEESCWRNLGPVVSKEDLETTMPDVLRKPRTLPGLEFLLPHRQLRTFETPLHFTEAHVEHALGPRFLQVLEPQTRSEKEAWELGTSSMRALITEPTISDRFRPSRTSFKNTRQFLWAADTRDLYLLPGSRQEDELSDDEDEDDEELKAREAAVSAELDEDTGGKTSNESLNSVAEGIGNSFDFENIEESFFKESRELVLTSTERASEKARLLQYGDIEYYKELLAVEIEASRKEKFTRLENRFLECQAAVLNPTLKFNVKDLR